MPDMPELEIDPARVERMILELGAIGAHSGTGVWRTTYSPEWVAANDLLREWGAAAGLSPRMDAVGNLWLRAEGVEDGPAVVSGSHIDSQCPGGRYDGALGVIAALVAVTELTRAFGPPRRPVEAVSLCEEEGSRFVGAEFWGSRGIVGRIAPGDVDRVKDWQGRPIREAMRDVGLDPDRAAEAKRDDIAAFLELHIEQGPVLEAADLPVAIVNGITAIRHRIVTLTGEANHAGAFPMRFRRDPMAGFAEIASGVIDHAYRVGDPAVTTIGRIEAFPNAPAIVPGRVVFTLDSRHPIQAEAERLSDAQDALMREVAARRGLGLSVETVLDHAACLCDPGLVATLEAAAAAQNVPHMRMYSGAGHDSQQMGLICPVAMIFVRSQDGRSHTPEEFSSIADIVAGVRTLAGALYRLAWA